VPPPYLFGFPGLLESLESVLPHRFQQPVARLATGLGRLNLHQRLLHQRAQKTQHLLWLLTHPDRLGSLQSEAPHEDRQAPERLSLGLREQIIAPVEGGAHGPLSLG
jgi:hypothetical protein